MQGVIRLITKLNADTESPRSHSQPLSTLTSIQANPFSRRSAVMSNSYGCLFFRPFAGLGFG
jgi:hypothetical protein